jgi:hypothetical protein
MDYGTLKRAPMGAWLSVNLSYKAMKKNDYKLSAEYRERFALNEGERYWMQEAIDLYSKMAKEELEHEMKQGKRLVIAPAFFDGLFDTISGKLDAWMQEERTVLQDSEE